MHADPRPRAETLLDECSRLVRRASLVVQRPPSGPAQLEELARAQLLVSEAIRCLEVLTGERAPREPKVPESSVGGIVSRFLGRHRDPNEELEAPKDSTQLQPPRKEELLHGHSKAVPIPDLLSFLRMQGKTGGLRVVLPSEVIWIQFDRGDLTAAISSNSPPGCLLGEILVAQGALHSKQLEAFLAHYTAAHGRLGGALEVVDLVTEEQLRAGLTCQIQRLFHRLFAADEAIFEFRNGETEAQHPETRLDVLHLLLESARHADELGARCAAAPSAGTSEPPPTLPLQEGAAALEELRAEIHARIGPDWPRA